MSRIINVKVSQSPKQVNTKFGWKTVCNFLNQEPHTHKDQREIVVWRPPNDGELMALKVGQQVQLLHDGKKYHLVNEPFNGNDTSTTQTHYQSNRNGHATQVDHQEDILDLPALSDVDKRNMMAYIRSQSKLLKFCYDTVCQDFPDLAQTDVRGARSLAISLLISANQCRDRYQR